MPGKDEEIKIRVPAAMKSAIKAIATKRYTSESEIAREALLEYLRSRHIELREDPAPYAGEPQISSARKAELSAKVMDFVKDSAADYQKKKRKKKETPKS